MLKLATYFLVTYAFWLAKCETSTARLRSGRVILRPATGFGLSHDSSSGSSSSSGTNSGSSSGISNMRTSGSSSSSSSTSRSSFSGGGNYGDSDYRDSGDSSDSSSSSSSNSSSGSSDSSSSGTLSASGADNVLPNLNQQQLFLIKYRGVASAGATLRSDLESGGGRVVSYIPDSTLLVFASSQLAVEVAGRHNALMAPYESDSKLSPEALRTMQAASPARHRRRRRHRQLLVTGNDIENGNNGVNESHVVNTDNVHRPHRHQHRHRPRGSYRDPRSLPSEQVMKLETLGYPDVNIPTATSNTDDALGSGVLRNLKTWDRREGSRGGNATNAGAARRRQTLLLQSPTDPAEGPRLAQAAEAVAADTVDPDLYGIEAHLMPYLPYEVREGALRQWPGALAQALGLTDATDPCKPQADGAALNGTYYVWLQIYMCAEDIQDGIDWLSRQSVVTWIAPAFRMVVQNDAAGWTIQTGDLNLERFIRPTAVLRPYWGKGIRGEGMLIGVGDTGVDLTHCFFLDDRYDIDTLARSLAGNPLSWTLDHRKIAQYIVTNPRDSFGDDAGGHGTHVAGSIAGSANAQPDALDSDSAFDSSAAATGAAPLARLSFVDTAPPGSSILDIPSPYDTLYLPLHYRVGVKISSDSWGAIAAADAVVYDSSAQSFDAFAWRNPDFISLVAANNYGYNGLMATVTTPATAKNTISVGATVNHPKDVTRLGDQYAFMFRYRDGNGRTQSSTLSPRVGSGVQAWYALLNNKVMPVTLADPRGACHVLSGNNTQAIVVVDLGDSECPYDQRAANVQLSGASAAIYFRPDNGFVTEDLLDTIPATMTYTLVTKAYGQWITSIMANSSNAKFTLAFLYYPLMNLGIDSVASFSSYGPTTDGRIKPDIVAPGSYVRSATAASPVSGNVTRDTCSEATHYLSGTSMATPLASGHVALMYQYFRDGFYPNGAKASLESTGFKPSGMLLKAAVVAGATSLQGGMAMQSGAILGAAPDGYQGWGRLSLAGALPLPPLTAPNFRIQVADLGTIEDGEQVYLHGIRATGTGPIHAALVWHDYPGALQATTALVNDLDLKFSVNGGALAATREDHVNNVERAELYDPKPGDNITFVVQGTNVVHWLLSSSGEDSQLPQRWALVVVGDFRGVLRTQLNPTYKRPQRLPAFATGDAAVGSVLLAVSLADGSCLAVDEASVVAVESGLTPYVFEFVEEKDSTTGGYFYIARDKSGNCVTISGDWSVSTLLCDDHNEDQRLAVFNNPYSERQLYQLVPKPYLGIGSDDRLCLGTLHQPRQQQQQQKQQAQLLGSASSETTSLVLGLTPCDADDPTQAFLLQSSADISHMPLKPSILPPSSLPSRPYPQPPPPVPRPPSPFPQSPPPVPKPPSPYPGPPPPVPKPPLPSPRLPTPVPKPPSPYPERQISRPPSPYPQPPLPAPKPPSPYPGPPLPAPKPPSPYPGLPPQLSRPPSPYPRPPTPVPRHPSPYPGPPPPVPKPPSPYPGLQPQLPRPPSPYPRPPTPAPTLPSHYHGLPPQVPRPPSPSPRPPMPAPQFPSSYKPTPTSPKATSPYAKPSTPVSGPPSPHLKPQPAMLSKPSSPNPQPPPTLPKQLSPQPQPLPPASRPPSAYPQPPRLLLKPPSTYSPYPQLLPSTSPKPPASQPAPPSRLPMAPWPTPMPTPLGVKPPLSASLPLQYSANPPSPAQPPILPSLSTPVKQRGPNQPSPSPPWSQAPSRGPPPPSFAPVAVQPDGSCSPSPPPPLQKATDSSELTPLTLPLYQLTFGDSRTAIGGSNKDAAQQLPPPLQQQANPAASSSSGGVGTAAMAGISLGSIAGVAAICMVASLARWWTHRRLCYLQITPR